jgi:plasmid maintenance system antidote protein VapI
MNHHSHPFGDLLRQYLHRKHGLSQNKLANDMYVSPGIISKMCKGERLDGPSARARIIQIIDWLCQQEVISTVEEANLLLKAAQHADLNPEQPAEANVLQKFMQSNNALNAINPPPSNGATNQPGKGAVDWGTSPAVREAEAVNCPTLRKLGRQQAHE